MTEITYDINVNIYVSIPIIGDESIMLISPPTGFSFKKILLNDYAFKDKLTDGNGNVVMDFFFAVHGSDNSRYIIAMEYEGNRVVKWNSPANSIGYMLGDDLNHIGSSLHEEYEAQIFAFFSMLHLYKEGEVARKITFYRFKTEEGICNGNLNTDSVCADMVTLVRHPMIIDPAEIDDINHFLSSHQNAYNMLKDVVISDLEYTYHTLDDATNYKNLMTPLEVMFLRNDYGDKKKMLSKRMAVFLESSDADIDNLRNRVSQAYVDRSDAIHEGIVDQLTRSALDTLRDLIRAATKKYITVVEQELSIDPSATFEEVKRKLINRLKAEVSLKNDANIWSINP